MRGHYCTQCSVAFTNQSPTRRAADYAFSQGAGAGRCHRRDRAHVMNVNELVRGLNVPGRDVDRSFRGVSNMVALGTDRSPRITRGHIRNCVGTSCIDHHLHASTMTHTGTSLGDDGRWIATSANNGIFVRGGAALPLSTALLTTACLATILEHRSKIGAVIGAPLLSFGVFCFLRLAGLEHACRFNFVKHCPRCFRCSIPSLLSFLLNIVAATFSYFRRG